MKNKRKYLLVFLIFLITVTSTLVVSKTFSFFNNKSTSEVNTFTTGEWVPAKTDLLLNHNNYIYSNQENISSYIDQSGEHYSIKINSDYQQFISFEYKISSPETVALFDYPVLKVLIGSKSALQVATKNTDDSWHEAHIDLAKLELDPGIYNINFDIQNTFDDQFKADFQVREVSTSKFFVKPESELIFTTNKDIKSLFVEYNVWENNLEVLRTEELALVTQDKKKFYKFVAPSTFSKTYLSFWSVDLFNNQEANNYLYLNVEKNLGATQFISQIFNETENEINLQTLFINISSSAKYFEAKVSQNPIVTDQDWNQATTINQKNHQQFNQNSLPTIYNNIEVKNNLVFKDIPTDSNYITLKICNINLICEKFYEFPL